MTALLRALADAYREGGVDALATEADRRMPPEGGHGWVDELIAGCGDPEFSVPASWLLLRHARSGRAIPAASVERLARRGLDADPHERDPHERAPYENDPVDARLHLAQLIQHLEIPATCAKPLAEFLTNGCQSEHAFLRAWAMDGLYRLSLQHPRYEEPARRALEAGADDPKASVRARARRIVSEEAKRQRKSR
ncbi:hypothetical protein Poly30_17820 [Planctomycetes bacterium Poly30]|uniref:HEAT repeat protein n=1 Tax=Saltatorellus ferox TaxID=2528018 RepID=A0A518EQA6_9BACT|nr:hypothetical protein Poly30_17820 [Planctomycetes bacterium Poly30]